MREDLAWAHREIDRLAEECDRIRFLSYEVEREYHPMNCVDVGMLLERQRTRIAALRSAVEEAHAALDESAGEFYQLSRKRSANLYRAREALRRVVAGKAEQKGGA